MPDFNDNRGEDRVGRRLARSGLVTASILALVFVVLGVVWGAHKRGRIHKLTEATPPPASPPPVRPGGQDVVRLARMDRADIIAPEFVGATLLPGVGSEIVQAVVNPESSSGVPILDGSSEEDLTKPVNQIRGAVFSVKVGPPEGSRDDEMKELVAGKPSQEQQNDILPDGNALMTKFNDAPPPSAAGQVAPTVEATVTTTISSRGLEVRMSTKNLGTSSRAVTMSWEPRFLLPRDGAQPVRLIPPATDGDSASMHRVASIPLTGKDFNQTYANLRYSYLSAGSETILENMGDAYSLRITSLTSAVRSVHIQASKGGRSVLVAFSSDDATPHVLAPGETLLWRIRVEAIPTSAIARAEAQ